MNHQSTERRPRHLRRVLGAAAAGALLSGLLAPAAQAVPVDPAPDGLSAFTAAASCYEIKLNTPSAPSGVYWLVTTALGAPQQFYCDQTTDGGGWVLVGRGREDWSQAEEGQGTAADVRTVVTGQQAFAARQLSSSTINALLDGGKVSALTEGIRIRRATNAAGTAWQEVRMTFNSPRDDWSWQFNAQQRVKTWSIGSQSGTGGTTRKFGNGSGLALLQTATGTEPDVSPAIVHGWSTGFGYGTSVEGSTSASTYLYKASTGYARPFAQLYLRPRLLSSTFAAIPDSGTPAFTQPSVASSRALATVQGVTGLGAAGTGIQDTEVSAFTESNGKVYVGGNFTTVQQDKAGTGAVKQGYLAAFDVKTGRFVPAFKPTFNHQIKALATLPDGRIVAGGVFSTVNGAARNGLVVLNPETGAIDTAFSGRLTNALSSSGGQVTVRALDVQDGWLYIGGSFTHATGGGAASVYSRAAVRVSVTNGTPDPTWTAEFDGTVISLDASARGDRVYFAGYFANDKGVPTMRVAALTASDAAIVPWKVAFASKDRANYQQAVREVGDRVWIGGAEHLTYSYFRADMSEASTNMFSREGGDGQALGDDGTNVYAGCHCYHAVYADAKTANWRDVGTAWTQVAKIDATAAFTASTARLVPAFSPTFSTREGAGTWAIFTDSTGVTWMGGDFTAARTGATGKAWVGGYARFPKRDAVAPTEPTNLRVVESATEVDLSWSGSTDASGAVTYQVLRNDRVVATTTATSITLPGTATGSKWFVRAADAAGNRSASTPSVGSIPASAVLVETGSTWAYSHPVAAPASDWASPAFDASSWSTGAGALGWGTSGLATQIAAPSSPRPLATYFRHTFAVDTVPANGVTITTRADDGVIVFVNGVEVGRSNLPSGTITHTSYASSARTTTTAVANPVTFTVPAALLQQGRNVIAAQVQSNYKSTPTVSFDLRAETR